MSEKNSSNNAQSNGQAGPDPDTIAAVIECVSAVAKERAKNLGPETNVVRLGLDSLERMEIIGSLEQRFGGQFPDDVLLEIETCTEIAEAVEEFVIDQSGGGSAGKIPQEYYQLDQLPEYRQLKQQLSMMVATGEPVPFFKVHDGVSRDTTIIDGREFINFSGYNYVGMSGDPDVTAAAQAALEEYGVGFAASPNHGGRHKLHEEFESELLEFLGAEAILSFVGGHITNETTIGHLCGPGDLVLHDSLAHNSIIQGAMLSRSRRRAFEHNDPDALDEILTELRPQHRHALVAIEGAYSMDGDYPDLPAFIDVAAKHNAMLFVDEAHSIGVMGVRGRGICEHFGIPHTDIDLSMGTLSKTFGSCGGYIASSHAIIEYLRHTAPGFVNTQSLSPSAAAAALAALRVLKREPERVALVQSRSHLLLQMARIHQLDTGDSGGTPVVPVITGNSLHAMQASRRLFEKGVNVQPILHPAVEEEKARLRFFVNCTHTEEQIRYTMNTLAEIMEDIDPRYVGK